MMSMLTGYQIIAWSYIIISDNLEIFCATGPDTGALDFKGKTSDN